MKHTGERGVGPPQVRVCLCVSWCVWVMQRTEKRFCACARVPVCKIFLCVCTRARVCAYVHVRKFVYRFMRGAVYWAAQQREREIEREGGGREGRGRGREGGAIESERVRERERERGRVYQERYSRMREVDRTKLCAARTDTSWYTVGCRVIVIKRRSGPP